jgi:signal-transduction protein with cAMP-binding, CBS, and nucleotidyltransferase domain
MTAEKASSALIVDGEGRLAGIVTEQDVTRRVAFSCTGTEPASAIMTRPVQSVAAIDYLYRAIATMRRFGWRHMPVVDDEDRPCGMLDLHDALAIAGEQTLRHVDRIAHDGGLEGLREIKAAEVDLAEDLFADSVPAPDVQALLTDINRDIHRRVLAAVLKDMAVAGHGPPPVDFAAIIMGSGGRGESFLFPDQDNGFILDDYPDERHTEIDAYFIELAERFTRALDAIGFPFCLGFVMATNPVWRKTRSQWRHQLGIWGHKSTETAAQLSDIFFDFRGFWGPEAWVEELREAALAMAGSSSAFLFALAGEATRHDVALGWFGRFVTEHKKPEHKGKINLKHAGTLPLVSAVRVMALRHGIAEVSTLARIAALKEKEVFSADDADYFDGALRQVTHLLLRQQLADFKAGKPVGNYLHPRRMRKREREQLIRALKAIRMLAEVVRLEFRGEVF